VLATIVLLRAFDATPQAPLKPWHHAARRASSAARDADSIDDARDYLAHEDRVMTEMEHEVYAPRSSPRIGMPRTGTGATARSTPSAFTPNWNRTQSLEPEERAPRRRPADPRPDRRAVLGARVAEIYRRHGFYALCIRMPGNGTVPGALTRRTGRTGGPRARSAFARPRRIGPALPLHLVGYSNGGEIVTQYAVDSLDEPALPRVQRLVLLSPMIGVSRFAKFAYVIDAVGADPVLRPSRWLDVLPEYIPFKYDSFPAFAGAADGRGDRRRSTVPGRAAKAGRIAEMPHPRLRFRWSIRRWRRGRPSTASSRACRTTEARSSSSTCNRSSTRPRRSSRTDFDEPLQRLLGLAPAGATHSL
jgi:hypothetical protein